MYVLLDIICAGFGMGVPFFCILFGLPVGWFIAKRISVHPYTFRQWLFKTLKRAALTSAFTVVIMLVVWMSSLLMLFDPTADLANYGIPLILYEPRASFIGWMVLMILISPFLQLLMTLLGSHLSMLRIVTKNEAVDQG
jgi:hypothetical protein